MTHQYQALNIIRAEHQTLTAVIDALKHVAAEVAMLEERWLVLQAEIEAFGTAAG